MTSVGISVATAEDGLAGLEKLADNNYDVIILDLQMPRMDGRAFYREMRARGCEAQVVILSAYGADSAQRELGAVAAIAKPFDPEVLTDTVRIVAERARKAS
jgi:DNA-binding response OmpR family regulator